MAIKELTCTLCHPMRALNLIRGKVNELIKAVNAGGGGSSSGEGTNKVIHFTPTEDGVSCGYSPLEVMQMIGDDPFIRFMYGVPGDMVMPLQWAFSQADDGSGGMWIVLYTVMFDGTQGNMLPVITVTENAFIGLA